MITMRLCREESRAGRAACANLIDCQCLGDFERNKYLPFCFYGMIFLGVVLAGLVLLVTFCCLAMSQKADEYQDHLEYELQQGHLFNISQASSGNADDFCLSPNSDTEQVDGV